MRLSLLSLMAGAAALVRAEPLGDSDTDKDAAKPTTFDNKPVPPLMELTPSTWADEVNKTRWLLVKHFRFDTGSSRC